LAAGLALLVLPAGCIQADQETTVYPDGSGKVVIEIGVKKSILKVAEEMAKQNGLQTGARPGAEDLFSEYEDPAKILKQTEGVVGWRTGTRKEEGDWIRASYIAYFDDVNQLKIYSSGSRPGEERKLSVAWRLSKLKNGGNALTLTSDLRGELDQMAGRRPAAGAKGSEELAKAMVEMMKPMLQDFKVALRVVVPGQIREATGFMESGGRRASFVMEGNSLIAASANPQGAEARRLQAVADAGDSRVTWFDVAVPSDELDAWRKELSSAKEDWARRTGGRGPSPAARPSDPEPAMSDDEIEAGFIRAKVKVARTHLEAGRKDKAREILEGVIKEFPAHVLTKEARDLLGTLK
jgi:hypothetical protein